MEGILLHFLSPTLDALHLTLTIEKAIIAEALYKNGSIAVKKIAQQLEISKTTLYLYLRHRKVAIGGKNTDILDR